jgi:hypothetical protein
VAQDNDRWQGIYTFDEEDLSYWFRLIKEVGDTLVAYIRRTNGHSTFSTIGENDGDKAGTLRPLAVAGVTIRDKERV